MKNKAPTRIGLMITFAGAICLSGCSTLRGTSTSTPTAPAAGGASASAVYMIAPTGDIAAYSASQPSGATTVNPIGTLAIPSPYIVTGPLATDSVGQIYVPVVDPINPNQLGAILIFPPNSTAAGSPSRTINVNAYYYSVDAFAVDPAGRIYVAFNMGSAADAPPPLVVVYSAGASGPATPLRTLELTDFFPTGISDIAADAAGNIYVAGVMNTINTNGTGAIAVYPPTAIGPSKASRAITFGTSNVYGVAVDSAGDVFANVCPGCYGTNLLIEEFAPGASEAASAIKTINLPSGAAETAYQGGFIRLDGRGNIFTSMTIFSPTLPDPQSFAIYGFGPAASGDATPIVQISPTNTQVSYFALND
jgi:hypothetical protein